MHIKPFKITSPSILVVVSALIFFTCTSSRSEGEETPEKQYSSVEERRIHVLMQQERDKIQEDAKEIDLRKKELKTLEDSVDKKIGEIDKKLDELRLLQNKIESLLAEKSAEEKKRIKDLSTIYEKMASDKAAQAITGMSPNLATDLLANMKPKAAAKILNKLEQQKASQLSTTFTTIQIE